MLRRLVPVLVAGIVLAACGSGDSGSGADGTSSETDAPTTLATPTDDGSGVVPTDVPEALQFSSPLIGGGDIELTTLAGRPVLLWFWAPW